MMKKRKLEMPHVFVILIGLVILAAVLTYIIPAGTYSRVVDEITKQKVVDPASFQYVDSKPVSLAKVPGYIFDAVVKAASTIFMVVFGTAAIEVLIATGAFDVALRRVIKKLEGRETIMLLVLMVFFALLGVNTNSIRYVAYIPLIVWMCRLCGYDAMCAVALVILSVGGTFSCGIASMSITAVAQELAGLPKFSGIAYRTLSAVIIFGLSAFYLLRYAKKVKRNPAASIVYDLECRARENGETTLSAETQKNMGPRQWCVIAIFILNVVISAVGCISWGWGNKEVSGLALVVAIAGGLSGGFSLNQIAVQFSKGASKMMTTGLMIGIAGAISTVMTDGLIVDTVVHSMANIFGLFPTILQPSLLYILNSVINCFITSGSGQAAVVMPIFLPLSDIVGITRQTCVLAFNFGDGFSNFLIPTAASLMGVIAAADISLTKWLRFFWKLFLLWSLAAMLLVTAAQLIHLGPM